MKADDLITVTYLLFPYISIYISLIFFICPWPPSIISHGYAGIADLHISKRLWQRRLGLLALEALAAMIIAI